MRVALSGGTGFLGRHLVERFVREPGVSVRALANQRQPLPCAENLTWIQGSIEDPTCLDQLMEADGIFVHLAHPPHWETQQHLASATALARAAARIGVRRFVYCSTAVVVGNVPADRVDEDTGCKPVTDYQRTKLLMERTLAKALAGLVELTVLRPSAIIGVGGQNLRKLTTELMAGRRCANYARSCLMGRRTTNLVCVENISAALLFLLRRKQAAAQETYFISDDDDPLNNYRDVEKILMRHLETPDYGLPVVPLPSFVLATVLRLLGRSGTNPRRVYDSSRLIRAGYCKASSLVEGIARFAHSIRDMR